MDDETFLQRFESAAFSPEEWHHPEHIKVAYLYLRRYPFDVALARLREKLEALNVVHKVPDLPTRGYHETITHAWLRLVQHTLEEYGPAESADAFYEQNPQLSQNKSLRLFYSRDLILSPRAKREYVAPDLTGFPVSNRSKSPNQSITA